MTTPWPLLRMAPFDLETTGTDPEEARIVEAYVGHTGGGMEPLDRDPLLVNPGVEVPAETTKFHGFTTEHVREHGVEAAYGVGVIAEAVAEAISLGIPLVGHNIVYDLTVLHRECTRHGLPTVQERTGGHLGPVIDTQVLSKHVDPWRPRVSEEQGAHVLKTCAQVFGVQWVDKEAHGARYDALVSARVAWWMGLFAFKPERRRRLSGREDLRHLFNDLAVDLPILHASQKRWKAEQSASLQNYLRSAKAGEKRDPDAVVPGEWPMLPYRSAVPSP